MGAHIMKSHVSRPFLREIEKEFNRIYPYLRIEFPRNGGTPPNARTDESGEETSRKNAYDLLQNTGMTDGMTVKELEVALLLSFDVPVQVFRKSGKMWIETKMTRDWTLKQQNDRGRELAAGEEG